MTDHNKCRSCGAEIQWVVTQNGKYMPLDVDEVHSGVRFKINDDGTCSHVTREGDPGYISHFGSCPNACEARKDS